MRMPLGAPDDLDPLLGRVGHARYVLLGEASHGTSEFYTWRSQISKRLILDKGFSFIAVEGDWPDCYRVNRYVKNMEGSGGSARNVLHAFDRWPTWMWANWETVALTNWLRKHNQERPPERRVGFYGLDVYSLWDSLHAVMNYVSRDGEMLKAAEAALRCFQPFGQDAITYARATALVPRSCAAEVAGMLAELRGAAPQYDGDGREGFFDAEQNALVVKNAEQYYRTMVRADDESWNVRDRHMVETLERLMQFHGPQAKAIVWEHNTHVGDARATDMTAAGMVNVGQLVREAHRPVDVIVVGFATHHGYVIAGDYWDAPMQRMRVPAASPGSWEDVLHEADAGDYSLLLDPRAAPDILLEPRPHRAIGVVFQPGREYFGNYVPTVLPQRYDALLYIDESRALHPLHLEPHTGHDPPETYPWGV
ncbi:MAG TPA: erythromycin esterase family protein [Phycisphaerae bacterium]